jgi:uncharacterized membrane protein YjjP (DUF1212 family)
LIGSWKVAFLHLRKEKNMTLNKLADLCGRTGTMLLQYGSDITRTEEVMVAMCSSQNVECESFVMPTGVLLSIHNDENETETKIKRVQSRGINLGRLESTETFIREFCNNKYTYEEAVSLLEKIEKETIYRSGIRYLALVVTVFAYTLLFQGNLTDVPVAIVVGVIVYWINMKIDDTKIISFILNFISGFVAGLLINLANLYLMPINTSAAVIGAILIYVPGVALNNGMQDMLKGNLTGLLRTVEALFIAIALGLGVAFSIVLVGVIGGAG